MQSSVGKKDIKQILLVEDEEDHALLIRRIFEENDGEREIDHVKSIGEAKKWINEHIGQDFLVISDYRLPDGTGLDLTGGAEHSMDMKFPLIIITGVGSEKLAVQSLKSGAMNYVVKGEDLNQLPQVAESVLREWDKINERRNAERDLREYIIDLEKSSANPDEFMDRIAQYLETSLTYDQESNKQLIENFRKKAAGGGRDGATGAGGMRPGMVNALDLLSKEGLSGAMMVVDMELGKNSNSWEALSAKADIFYLQERYYESLDACNKALKINLQNALVWNIKGNVLYRLERYDQAIECYNKAIEISPLFPRSWYNKKLALELQLKKSMKKISVRATLKDRTLKDRTSGDNA
ncbi:MAG: Methanosis regulatory protein FilR1 [Euryarchaeota archaeon]|nr:Methanosis regulatory protein FilR1 [Euryarchaeota archaeon]